MLKGFFKSVLGESITDGNSPHRLMAAASSSSSSARQYSYDVFPSFCGKDVRRSFLSHFLERLKRNGISTFIDNGIKRSGSIKSEIIRAIEKSRIAVVILSKNYASSSWCLDELHLIMQCRQTVMAVFYDVDPSDVKKQTGEFGMAFEKTCYGNTEEDKLRWRQALTKVADIAGEHSTSWDSEWEMILKIVKDVSYELPSTDFDRLVGIEAHVEKLKSMIRLESDEVKMVGIWGPAGIGKTTIAKALYNQVSGNFQLKFYKENLEGTDKMPQPENFDLQNHLQKELLSGVLDHRDKKISDLGEAEERLKHQRVLLILDDVPLNELKALGDVIQGLRFGSKVIVTSENIDTLRDCGINQIYKVAFPSSEEALQIFSYSAFGQSSPPRSYLEQADEVAKLVAQIPLGLKMVGSSLRGKRTVEWIMALPKLKTYPDDNDIEIAIRFSYDGLSGKHKTLLLMLTDSLSSGEENVKDVIISLSPRYWDVEKGIQTLVDRGLISISQEIILMHYLVRLMCIKLSWSS